MANSKIAASTAANSLNMANPRGFFEAMLDPMIESGSRPP
jgi:hypothetical protein